MLSCMPFISSTQLPRQCDLGNVRAHRALCLAPGMDLCSEMPGTARLCVSGTQGAGLGFWALSA